MSLQGTDAISIDTGTDELLCSVRDRVATITLNRPQARNSLSDKLSPALRAMIKVCGEDNSIGALLITGAGTAFCAGGDVKGMGSNSAKKTMTFDERLRLDIEYVRTRSLWLDLKILFWTVKSVLHRKGA